MKFLVLLAVVAVCAAAPQQSQQGGQQKTRQKVTSQQGVQDGSLLTLYETRRIRHPQLKQDQSEAYTSVFQTETPSSVQLLPKVTYNPPRMSPIPKTESAFGTTANSNW